MITEETKRIVLAAAAEWEAATLDAQSGEREALIKGAVKSRLSTLMASKIDAVLERTVRDSGSEILQKAALDAVYSWVAESGLPQRLLTDERRARLHEAATDSMDSISLAPAEDLLYASILRAEAEGFALEDLEDMFALSDIREVLKMASKRRVEVLRLHYLYNID